MNMQRIPEILQWAEGNPGALNFLLRVFQYTETTIADFIFTQLGLYKTIRGTNLYVLYVDLCHHDIDKVHTLLTNCPQDVLEAACSKQDYSGRELVAKYLQRNTIENKHILGK